MIISSLNLVTNHTDLPRHGHLDRRWQCAQKNEDHQKRDDHKRAEAGEIEGCGGYGDGEVEERVSLLPCEDLGSQGGNGGGSERES